MTEQQINEMAAARDAATDFFVGQGASRGVADEIAADLSSCELELFGYVCRCLDCAPDYDDGDPNGRRVPASGMTLTTYGGGL